MVTGRALAQAADGRGNTMSCVTSPRPLTLLIRSIHVLPTRGPPPICLTSSECSSPVDVHPACPTSRTASPLCSVLPVDPRSIQFPLPFPTYTHAHDCNSVNILFLTGTFAKDVRTRCSLTVLPCRRTRKLPQPQPLPALPLRLCQLLLLAFNKLHFLPESES